MVLGSPLGTRDSGDNHGAHPQFGEANDLVQAVVGQGKGNLGCAAAVPLGHKESFLAALIEIVIHPTGNGGVMKR